jgi:alkylation response protein AidB-like acyl-CoA dehydrogenase
MGFNLAWGPQQAEVADRVLGLARGQGVLRPTEGGDGRPAEEVVASLRQALGEAGLLAVDAPVAVGGGGRTLLDALAVAEALGHALPEPVSLPLVAGVPARLLGLLSETALLKSCVLGQAPVALLDAGTWPMKLERRPGGTQRLVGEVPAALVPPGARHAVLAFRDRPDWLALACVPLAHLSLRGTVLPEVSATLVQGLVDVEVTDAQVVTGAPLEVKRALASEELVRAARAVGQGWAALEAATGRARRVPAGADPHQADQAPVRRLVDAVCWLLLSRHGVHAAAERLVNGGPHTLLGEEPRLGVICAALEARAVAHHALRDVARALDRCLEVPPLSDTVGGAGSEVAYLCSRLDLAATQALDEARGVMARLGDGRLGVLPALQQARPAGGAAGKAESTRPGTGTGTETEARAAPGDPRPERRTSSGRSSTSRAAPGEVDLGPWPFVPEEAGRARQEARRWVAEQLYGGAPAVERDGAAWGPVLEAIKARGLLGIVAPREQGGLGHGVPAWLATQEELARAHPAVGTTVACGNAVASLIMALGPAEGSQGERLEAVATGRVACALAWAAPGVTGSSCPSVRAQPVGQGGGFRLAGSLRGVPGVEGAGVLVVGVPEGLGGSGGPWWLWLDAAQPGVEVRPWQHGKVRRWGDVEFHDVEVAPEQVMGDGGGPGALARVADVVRLDAAARLLGITAHLLELWRAGLTGRTAQTSSAHTRALGHLWARLACGRALTWGSALRLAQGEPDPAHVSASMLTAAQVSQDALDGALTALGPEALVGASRLRMHLVHARQLALLAGGVVAQRAQVDSVLA